MAKEREKDDSQHLMTFNPLFMAMDFGYLKIVDLLLQRGASIFVSDGRGENILMKAAKNCLQDMIDCLLEAGIDPNATDNTGRPALAHAAMGGCLSIFQKLLPLTNLDFVYRIYGGDGTILLDAVMYPPNYYGTITTEERSPEIVDIILNQLQFDATMSNQFSSDIFYDADTREDSNFHGNRMEHV